MTVSETLDARDRDSETRKGHGAYDSLDGHSTADSGRPRGYSQLGAHADASSLR